MNFERVWPRAAGSEGKLLKLRRSARAFSLPIPVHRLCIALLHIVSISSTMHQINPDETSSLD